MHELTKLIMKRGSDGIAATSIYNETLDQEIRWWLDNKINTWSPGITMREHFGLTKQEWCKHCVIGVNGRTWTHYMTSHPCISIPNEWVECPICSAPRPKV